MKKIALFVCLALTGALLLTNTRAFAAADETGGLERKTRTPGARATEQALDVTPEPPGEEGGEEQGKGKGLAKGQDKDKQKGQEKQNGSDNEKAKGKKLTFRGTVTAVSVDSLTLTLADSTTATFSLTENTQIKIPTYGQDASFEALNYGVQAVVVAALVEEGPAMEALKVQVIPGKPQKFHRVGVVTAYEAGLSITILAKDGKEYTFAIDPNVKLLPADRVGLLAVDARVTIICPRDPALGVPPPPVAQDPSVAVDPNVIQEPTQLTGYPVAKGIVVHPPVDTETVEGETETVPAP